MARWTVDAPTSLEFDGVVAVKVAAVSGSVAVLSTSERPGLEVSGVTGPPLSVTHEAGILTVAYQDLGWDTLLHWLRAELHEAHISVAVPNGCPARVSVLTASATVGGIEASTSVRSLSGSITLDGVTGSITADTVSGNVEARGLAGRLSFKSVSGDLTLANGSLDRLDAKTVSGRMTADLARACGALQIATVSGPVTIRLPADANARVRLRSAAGRVRSEFAGLDRLDRPGTTTLTGTLGAGSGQLAVTTMSGQVTLLERGDPATPGPRPEGGAR
jgi:hypothetical protein